MKCEKCSSQDSVLEVSIPVSDNRENISLCLNCRIQIFDIEIFQIEDSPISVTKKIEITLTEKDWDWIDEKSSKNYSGYFRNLLLALKTLSSS